MQAFQADLAKFERRNSQVVGVSSDIIGTHKRGVPNNKELLKKLDEIVMKRP